MPVYRHNGDVYDIPQDKAREFESQFPEATVEVYSGNDVYDIPVGVQDEFFSRYSDAKYSPTQGVDTDSDGSVRITEPKEEESRFGILGKMGQYMGSPSAYVPMPQAEEREELTQVEIGQRAAMRQMLQESGTIDRMEEMEKEARKNKFKAFGEALAYTPQVSSFGVASNIYKDTEEQLADAQRALEASEEHRQNKAMEQTLDVALDKARAGEWGGIGGNNVGNGVVDFGLGLWDSATRMSTWDFGVSDTLNGLTIAQVVKKWEEDPESLTATERNLLDTMGMATAVQEAYQDQVGIGYAVGESLPQSAGFMASMYLNPASGLGKSLARQAVKKYGRQSIAKNLARIGGDIAETAIMTATTGGGRVVADALDRINGQSTYEIDPETGLVMYGGQEDQKTVGEAVVKAIGSNFIDNYSEALGEYFDPLLGMSRRLAAGGLRKMNLDKWADALSDVQPSQMAASIRSLREKAKFGGVFGEIMEEEVGMALNAITVGDYTFSKEEADASNGKKQWIFDLENQLTTALSCAIMSGAMTGVETIGNVRYRREMERSVADAEKAARAAVGDEMIAQIDQSSPEGMVDILRDAYMDQNLSLQQKRTLADYATQRVRMQYYNAADAKARRQINVTQQNTIDAYEAGRHAQLPQYYNIDQEYRKSEAAINERENAEEIWDAIRLMNNMDENERQNIMRDFSEEDQELIRNWRYNAYRRKGAVNHRAEQVEDLVDEYAGQVNPYVVEDKQGNRNVTTAVYGDNVVYVMAQNADGATTIVTNDGSKKMVNANELEHVQTHNADELIERFRQQTTEVVNQETEKNLSYPSGVLEPAEGVTVETLDGKQWQVAATDGENVEIVGLVFDKKSGQWIQGGGAKTMTREQFMDWQKAELDRKKANTYEQGDELVFYVNGEPIDAEITGIDPEGNYYVHVSNLVDGLDKAVSDVYTAEELRKLTTPSSKVSAETTENESMATDKIKQSVSEEVANGQVEDNVTEPTAEVAESVNTPQMKAAELLNAELEAEEIDDNVAYHTQAAVDAADKKLKKKPTMKDAKGDVAAYKALKAQWQAELNELQKTVQYWSDVAKEIAAYRESMEAMKPQNRVVPAMPYVPVGEGDKLEQKMAKPTTTVAEMNAAIGEPQSLEEYVLMTLASKPRQLRWADKENGTKGFGSHTGLSDKERQLRKEMVSDEEGLTPEEFAHKLVENMDASFGEVDVMDITDMVIDYVSSFTTRKDMLRSIISSRADMMRAQEADAQEAANAWYVEQYHATEEELVAYNEWLGEIDEENLPSEEEIQEVYSIFAEEQLNYDNERTNASLLRAADSREGQEATPDGGNAVGAAEQSAIAGAVESTPIEGAADNTAEAGEDVREDADEVEAWEAVTKQRIEELENEAASLEDEIYEIEEAGGDAEALRGRFDEVLMELDGLRSLSEENYKDENVQEERKEGRTLRRRSESTQDAVLPRAATLSARHLHQGRAESPTDEALAIIRSVNKGKTLLAQNGFEREWLKELRRMTNNEVDSLLKTCEAVANDPQSKDRNEADALAALIRRFKRRGERKAIIETLTGAKVGENIPLSKIDELFNGNNSDANAAELYGRVRAIAEKIGLEFVFDDTMEDNQLGGYNIVTNRVRLNPHMLYASLANSQTFATTILHEMLHSVAMYAVKTQRMIRAGVTPPINLPNSVLQAANTLIDVYYKVVKDNKSLVHQEYDAETGEMVTVPDYGTTSVNEMISELADPEFREKLKNIKYRKRSVLDAIKDIFKRMFSKSSDVTENPSAYDMMAKAVDELIDSFSQEGYQEAAQNELYWEPQAKTVTDKATIEALEASPKAKAYRAMQIIDGELYPPMSAVVDGKLREPSKLGQWEQAEENPELADENGKFKLNKGNKKSVPAAYNPYIHSSSTPLNDQFSEAQDRPNLVTVEVEIPQSEADGTSGYKAEKAKDAVGRHDWKAGVIQGQLTGTREVFLSRWDKPIRVVPDSEVADRIVEMFDSKNIVMPSNVVTPSLRAELEARGIEFVETDNQGKLTEGENKGATYSSVYGKKAKKTGEGVLFREEKKELVAVHNISEDNLRKVLEAGSLIMPSIAITKADMGHSSFGDISLIFGKDTIDPSDNRNKVYGGDAWTPRFPQIGVKLNSDVIKGIRKKIYDLIEDDKLRELFSLSAEIHPINMEPSISKYGLKEYYAKEWMKLAYLLDSGKKVKTPMRSRDYGDVSDNIVEMAKARGIKVKDINEDTYAFFESNPEFAAELATAQADVFVDSLPEEKREGAHEKFRELYAKRMNFNVFDRLIRNAAELERDLENGGRKKIIDTSALSELIRKKVKTDNAEYNKWVDNLFEGIVEKRGVRNNTERYTRSGNQRSWEQLYDEATPANILKYMLAQNEQGGSGGFFDSNIMGASAETYESIDEIREKGKKRLKKLGYEEYDEWSTSVTDRINEICDEFLTPSQKAQFGASIDAKIEISNIVAKDKTAKGIYKGMKRSYPNFTMKQANQIEAIVKEIQDFATGYFEAKPRRLVPLSEVKVAVVPKKTSSDIVEALEAKGVKVVTYSGTEEARKRVVKRESEGVRFREGEGEISDKEVSYQNDPIAKWMGKPRYYGKKASEFAERERGRMVQAANEVAEALGLKIEVVTDVANTSENTQRLLREHKKAKGWYNTNTGEIVVVVPNHVSAWDAVQTVLHEGIAHHGLRNLFGEKLDVVLDNIYNNVAPELKAKIDAIADARGLDKRTATEEYLASLAEDTNFEEAVKQGWWAKIKSWFAKMFGSLTDADASFFEKFTDNELRYILWSSYQKLTQRVQTPMQKIEDNAMQMELKVGNYAPAAMAAESRVAEPTFTLSNKKDNEGNRFYEKDGSIDIWRVDELLRKARRQVAPIRLTDKNVKHIIDEHSSEIGSSDKAIIDFLDIVFSKAKRLRKARGRAMFVVVENDFTDKVAIIKLYPSAYGNYYNVETAGYYRKGKWKNIEEVIAELSEPTQSDAESDVSKPQNPNKIGREAFNAETATTSADKVSDNSSTAQEEGGNILLREEDTSLMDALADAYSKNDKQAIQKAVNDIKEAVRDEEYVSIGDYYFDEVEDYDGNDPKILAAQYIVRYAHDRYLDYDDDQEYIRTGVKTIESKSTTAEGDKQNQKPMSLDARKAQKAFEEKVKEEQAKSKKGVWLWNGLMSTEEINERAEKLKAEVDELISAREHDKAAEVLGHLRAFQDAAKRYIKNPYNEIPNIAEENTIRFRDGTPFFSNAERAVEDIKQNKATPEQWLAMIKKGGGLKAGEDKWMGLSDWLTEKKEAGVKSLTKDEVLEFIRTNEIHIEEVEYGDNPQSFEELKDEYEELLREEGYDAAHDAMIDRFGDDFDVAFEDLGGELSIANEEAAATLLGSGNIINHTRLDHTTEGLENKKEIAFVVPTIESWNQSDNIHFGDAGEGRAVAWVRFGETTDEDGNRVLVIDEVQSKRHDEGRAKGYKSNARLKELEREYDALIDEQVELTKEILHDAGYAHKSEREGVYNETMQLKAETGLIGTEEQRARYNDLSNKFYEVSSEQRKLRNAIPDAPFDKNYHELVMKRMLRYAAENGFDKVAWNTGKQVAKRFGISQAVSSIEYSPLSNGHYKVIAYGALGYPLENVPTVYNSEQEIADTFGRGIASKIVNDIEENKKAEEKYNAELKELKERRKGIDEESEEYEQILEEAGRLLSLRDATREAKSIEGEGLSIGGEDRNALYDEMIPRFMNKYTKKWGAKVGEVTLPNVEEAGRTMWSVDVTPEMRESVMQGQPMFREGMGAISDREVSYENDPIAKFQGKPRYYGKRASAFAERERRRMENAAKEAAEMLGIEAEIITDASTLKGRKAKAKGWYDISNKKVVVVVPNHVSIGDAVRTVLHEGVAHHGLRELFGDGFDAMLDNIYNNVAPELKARIDAIAERTGVSTSVATEEYLASLAETTNFEEAMNRGWWSKIKQFFVDMLNKLGMPGLNLKEEITDNELRYLLWRSYQNLVDPNAYLKPLGYLDDVAKQKELKVGNYAENTMATQRAAEMNEAEEWSAITIQRIEELEAQAAQLENEIADMEADRDADDESRYDMWEEQLDVLRKQSQEIYDELEGLYSLEAEDEYIADYEAEREAEKQRLLYQKRIDNAYLKAVREGNWEEATNLFRQYVLSKAEDDGIVPMDYGVGYRGGAHSSIAKKVKEENPDAIAEAAYQMSIRIPKGSILVPMPSRNGDATYTVKLAEAIAKATDSEVRDVLKGKARMSVYEAKQKGIKMTPEDLGMYTTEELPRGKNIVIIDNVIDKGTTALAAVSAVKGASVVAYAYTLGDKQRAATLKLAEPVTYDDNKRIIPLSQRFNKETDDIRYRLVDNQAEIDRLESEPTIKAYRAMQVINGELYPPMSAVVDGKLREPIALGQWEQSEERPDLADDNGRFKLDKGNKKSLKAAYNPYFHSSSTPLNDQFSEAQDRDNLVTVEVEVPVSEADGTSGYKAEKAKDAVGTHQWKAGIIQGQLTGTREVFLTRWDKPIRIVPESEVADVIVEMFDGKDIVMPSNVVTPQLRKELEARGITFVETDNQGKLVEGEHKGEHYSKVYGKKSTNKSKKNAEITAEIEREAAALGVPVRIVRSVDELPDEDTRKRAVDGQLKGYFDPRTGEVVVYEPNTDNANDAKRTVLHEIVGHKGLRQLIGEERYDKAMVQLMYMLPSEVRDAVLRRAERHGWNAAIAMDEYLAEQAERDVQPTWWGKVNAKIRALLRNLGFDVKLTDADVTYLLWRSRKKLMGDTAFDMATNAILKQAARKSAEADAWNEQSFKDAEMRDFEKGAMQRLRNRIGDAQNEYDSAMKTMAFKQRESWQDSMRSLKVFMDIVSKESGKKIADFENAYMYENAMSSANLMEMQMFRHDVYGRLLKAINELMESGAKYEEVVDYMMAKHGLERNEKMARKRAEKEAEGDAAKEAALYAKYRGEDLSGLTALTGVDNVGDAEAAAMQMIADFEAKHNTDLLWNETRACTQTILNISHDAGILSDEVYGELWNQYEYYIPLRGFDGTTAEEVYTYVGDNKSPYNAPIKTAKGRKSKADDPIATIATMAESAIVEANRNRLKQRFLYMVERHRTELASVSSVWVEKDPITGDCVARFANIPNDATPEEAAQAQKAFEERMEQLNEQEPERYYKASEKPNIPYRVEKKANEHEHQVIVKRNGKDVVITINGDPRVAQAINGLTNAEAVEGFSKFAGKVNRFLSANFTTRNPAFVVSNFVRDGFYTNSMVWAKESPAYAWKYNQNWAKATKLLPSLVSKYKRYEKGDKSALDMSDPVERAFYEFMINGGETGYTVINSVEDYKGIVAGDLKTMQGGVVGNTKKAVQAVGEVLDTFGRWAEDTSRFAAFLTSREMGRSVTKSIWDAKEVSVNFNKKGSGRKMTQRDKGLNSILGWMSQQGRNLYVFWNAGWQGMFNFGKAVKEHPGKMAGLAGVYFGLGMAMAAIFGGHDDDEDYWNLPEYVRRNNICFRVGNKFVTLPLPIELRAIYGMGELAMSWMAGKEDPKKVGMKVVQQMSQVMPIDMMAEGGGLMAFVPSWAKPIVEVGVNTDWTGMPIYRKRTPWNEYDPQWMLAFKSTSPELVAASRAINEATNKNLPSGKENKYDSGWADIEYLNNPAAWEHIAEGYLGGLATMFNQTKKSAMAIWNEDLREVRNAPVISRFLKDAGEKSEEYALREDYFNAKGVVDELRSQRGHFRKESIDPSLTEEQRKDVMESRIEMEKMVNATISQWNNLENARKRLEDMVKDNPDQEVTFDGKKGNAKDALDEVTRRMVKLTEGYQ